MRAKLRQAPMHELSVCQSLITEVARIAAAHGATRVSRIELAIGPLSGVEPALIEDAFTIASAGTAAEGARLVIEAAPVVVFCPACEAETEAAPNRLLCGRCGGWQVRLRSGDELLIKRVELVTREDEGEDSCARTAAAQ